MFRKPRGKKRVGLPLRQTLVVLAITGFLCGGTALMALNSTGSYKARKKVLKKKALAVQIEKEKKEAVAAAARAREAAQPKDSLVLAGVKEKKGFKFRKSMLKSGEFGSLKKNSGGGIDFGRGGIGAVGGRRMSMASGVGRKFDAMRLGQGKGKLKSLNPGGGSQGSGGMAGMMKSLMGGSGGIMGGAGGGAQASAGTPEKSEIAAKLDDFGGQLASLRQSWGVAPMDDRPKSMGGKAGRMLSSVSRAASAVLGRLTGGAATTSREGGGPAASGEPSQSYARDIGTGPGAAPAPKARGYRPDPADSVMDTMQIFIVAAAGILAALALLAMNPTRHQFKIKWIRRALVGLCAVIMLLAAVMMDWGFGNVGMSYIGTAAVLALYSLGGLPNAVGPIIMMVAAALPAAAMKEYMKSVKKPDWEAQKYYWA